MEPLRRVLATIRAQAGRLTASQRLLIGSLAVVAVMALFLVSQYAGTSQMVSLLPGATADEQQKAVSFLQTAGIQAKLKNGGLFVPEGSQYIALAQLQQGQKLPADKKVLLDTLAQNQNWMMPKSQLDQMHNTAVQNELAKIVANFKDVEQADVFISNPPPSGLGGTFRKPSATVTVHTRSGPGLTQEMVDSLADLVAGSTAGLASSEVRVVDSAKGKRYKARSPDDYSASSYLEQAMNFEKRVQDKLLDGLNYIDGVIVTVNAQVDVSKTQTTSHEFLPKDKGTVALLGAETNTNNIQSQSAPGAEPGVRPNAQMNINGSSGAGSGTTSTEESVDTKMENHVGTKDRTQVDPSGRPTKVNVAVGVPMAWVVQIYKQRKGPTGGAGGKDDQPSDAQINEVWDNASTDPKQRGEKQRLEELLQPLVETAAAAEGGQSLGKVVVSMIPVLTPASMTGGGGKAGILGSGGIGGIGGLAQGPLLKTVMLGGLAVVALAMMLMMVRRSSRPEPMPSAEELAGIPPKLHADSDLVGEAAEGDTAMAGIEIDDDSLRSKKMLEQVSDLIKKNPGEAATVFNRWLATEA